MYAKHLTSRISYYSFIIISLIAMGCKTSQLNCIHSEQLGNNGSNWVRGTAVGGKLKVVT